MQTTLTNADSPWVPDFQNMVVCTPDLPDGATSPALDFVGRGVPYTIASNVPVGYTTILGSGASIFSSGGNQIVSIEKVFVAALAADSSTVVIHLPQGVLPETWSGVDGDSIPIQGWDLRPTDDGTSKNDGIATFSGTTGNITLDTSGGVVITPTDPWDLCITGNGNGCTSRFIVTSPIATQNANTGDVPLDPLDLTGNYGVRIPLLNMATAPTLFGPTPSAHVVILSITPVRGVDVQYRIYRSTDGYTTAFYDGPAGNEVIADTGLTANTAYHYKVNAYNTAGTTVKSTVYTFTTAASASSRVRSFFFGIEP